MHSSEIEITIPFHDVDAMQIVWHGWYAKYFELARCALLDQINYVVRDADKKERLTKGYTTQVAVDLASGEMCWESPRILWEKLGLNEA